VESSPSDVTLLIARLSKGDANAASELMPVVYDELRRLAARYMRQERPDHTLQATALVHEAYLRLIEQRHANWQNRAHFFGVAAQLMRRILVDHARGHLRVKRGGEQPLSQLRSAITGKIGSHVTIRQTQVATNARTAIIFSLSPGEAHDAPVGRQLLLELGHHFIRSALSRRALPRGGACSASRK